MRNRRLISAAAISAVALVILVSGASQAGADTGSIAVAAIAQPVAATAAAPANIERSFFVRIPERFKTLQRAPVLFPHDRHAVALESEGCDACHPKENNQFTFTFPVGRDDHNRNAFMNTFHDACITCHTKRRSAGKKSGPLTCGECHSDKVAYREEKYLPKMPEYYSPLRDTYHKNCIACHQSPAKSAEEAKGLDWKNFYVKEKERQTIEFPKVRFDYLLHDKHDKTLEGKCENCHYLAPELKAKLAAENRKPSSQDWLRGVENGRSLVKEDEAHPRCINCHLSRARQNLKAGPAYCKDCHTGVVRKPSELKDVPRPECDEKSNRAFLIKGAKDKSMNDVPFDHKAHMARGRSCQECHHDTLEACRTCHTPTGDSTGKFVTLAEAFHAPSSTWSCVGCHDKVKKKPDCAGCHAARPSGLTPGSCATCHSGALAALDSAAKKPDPETLFPKDLKDEMEAKLLAKEYEPAKFKHKEIVKALTDISNKSTLATYFHRDEMTICMGCHHMGPLEKNKPVPPCSACHTARREPTGRTPALLGALHQNCIECHKQMKRPEEKMPLKCEGCHKESRISKSEIPNKAK